MVKGYKNINNDRYYFDYSSGKAISGLKLVSQKLYYFDPNTHKAITGFKTIDNDTYYFHNTYSYALEGLQSFGEDLYYFNTDNYKMLKNNDIVYANINFTFGDDGICNDMKIIEEAKDDIRTNLLLTAFSKLGVTYGPTNNNQLRCNTFAAYCYNSMGINVLNNLTSNRQAKYVLENKKNISYENLKPGDLIFFNNENCGDDNCSREEIFDGVKYHVHHIAIYLGEGKRIESTSVVPEGVGRVKVSDFNPNTTNKDYYPVMYANIID